MRFSFTGNLVLNELNTKNPYVRNGKTQSGLDYMSFNASVVAAVNNRGYIESFGMKSKEIKTLDTDNNKITISFDDRFDSEIVKSVANYKKHIVDLFDDRKEFITEWDMIEYLIDNADKLKDLKVTVTGQIQKNFYNGECSNRFVIQNIYRAADDAKNKLSVTAEMFFGKDDIDMNDWASEKKLYINGYTNEFIDKGTLGADKGANKYVSQQFIFDASKLDLENEKHVNLLKYKLKMLGCELDGNKVKVKLGKNVYSMMVVVSYQNGAEVVEFSEDMLTDTQKEAVALGLKTVEDFRPAGSTFGDRVTLFKIVDFDLRGKYEDGLNDTEIKISEFEDNIFVQANVETEDDVFANEPEKMSDEAEDELEDLFG